MTTLNSIREYYRKLPDFELEQLVNESRQLKVDAIPVLIDELESRGIKRHTILLMDNQKSIEIDALTPEQLWAYISRRMELGETADQINEDLDRRSIQSPVRAVNPEDMNRVNAEAHKAQMLNRVMEMKESGFSEQDIRAHLKEEDVSAEEYRDMNELLRKQGNKNIVTGGLWFMGGLVITLASVGAGQGVIAYGAVIFGLIQLVRGFVQVSQAKRQ